MRKLSATPFPNHLTVAGPGGEFLVSRCRVELMPPAGEHLVGFCRIEEGMDALTEITPDGRVQLYIPDANYLAGPVPFDSAGGVARVNDALAAIRKAPSPPN